MGESGVQLIKDMLHGAVRALAATEVYLKMKGKYESGKVEFKATLWVPYFQQCQDYISGKGVDKPSMPASSRRIRCPPHMVAHPELSTINFLPMDLPEPSVNSEAEHDRGDLVRLVSEWVFSSSFQLDPSNSTLNSDLNSPQTPKPSNRNIFCLVSEAESGLNSLPIARLMDCLNEMGYLGGYFSFAPSRNNLPARTSQRTVDALPMTLTHQACTVEADALQSFIKAFAKDPGAVNENMEKRFEVLFASPLRAFVTGRPGFAWKPLDPMVFVLDCNDLADTSWLMESHTNSGKERSDPEDVATREKDRRLALARLVEWATSRVVRTLPGHVKFLILANKKSGLGNSLRDKGAAFVYEVQPIVSYV
ncbi:hypothetical protein M413DRAFT_350863 [Hebeloma cylindrosporum]|uniref:Uncharacterized protein n=1 Tax=Hebeloma cylindrosporum TaxID=76867 RepID=A0A0C2Y2L8_HEBCY|nr:hypothetical protein M413DRAFT_350863 [Hebeloma cylindrosporum h7]